MLHKLNYMRQMGIPFAKEERAVGSGNRVNYGFDELIECGVALYAIGVGMKPADLKAVLIEQRTSMRRLYRRALREQPEAALTAAWVKSRGRIGALQGQSIWLRMHDRYSDSPGAIETVTQDEVDPLLAMGLFDPVERYPGQPTRRLLPLTRLALQWTAWALEAPVIRTGPKT